MRTATVDGVGALIDRPGVSEIMLDFRSDIRGHGPTFKSMQQFLRDRQPPTLVAAGVNDEIVPLASGLRP
jgi:hypothetical protein